MKAPINSGPRRAPGDVVPEDSPFREPLRLQRRSYEAYEVLDDGGATVGTLYADRVFAGTGSSTTYWVRYLDLGEIAFDADWLPAEGRRVGSACRQADALDLIRGAARDAELDRRIVEERGGPSAPRPMTADERAAIDGVWGRFG